MNKNQKIILGLLIFIIISSIIMWIFIPLIFEFNPWYDSPVLEFPVQDINNVTKLSGYNHPDWGEPGVYHNGIDLVCKNFTRIISPVDGIVLSITETLNPYNNYMMFHVSILINYFWTLKIVFEPFYNTTEENQLQKSLILVKPFQKIKTGQTIGYLLNGSSDYSHIHLMLTRNLRGTVCPYYYSSDLSKTYYEIIANKTGETICYQGPNASDDLYDFYIFLIITIIICVILVLLLKYLP